MEQSKWRKWSLWFMRFRAGLGVQYSIITTCFIKQILTNRFTCQIWQICLKALCKMGQLAGLSGCLKSKDVRCKHIRKTHLRFETQSTLSSGSPTGKKAPMEGGDGKELS
jgi:hypothetical protein